MDGSSNLGLLHNVDAVVFDAVGTVMFPTPSVADAYRRAVTLHCGVQLSAETVTRVVREGLQQRSREIDLRTNEAAEHEFWAGLIRQLCPGGDGFAACFDDLFSHFAQPANWQCFPEVATVLPTLQRAGLTTAIASNFDRRLHTVCDGLPGLANVEARIISSEIGWRKPAREFFSVVTAQLGLPPERILFVGDDPSNDVNGALAAGMQAAWICRDETTSPVPPGAVRLRSLEDLLKVDSTPEADSDSQKAVR